MRSRQHAPPRRRSAAEWARLVDDLHESGLSPEDFAASRGVPLARLGGCAALIALSQAACYAGLRDFYRNGDLIQR